MISLFIIKLTPLFPVATTTNTPAFMGGGISGVTLLDNGFLASMGVKTPPEAKNLSII